MPILEPGKVYDVIVRFRVPERVETAEVVTFIKNALGSWGGQFHPNDPLFSSLEGVHLGKIAPNAKRPKYTKRQQTPISPN